MLLSRFKVTLLFAVFGLGSSVAAAQSAQSKSPLFSLSISAPQKTVKLGSDIKVEATITNISQQDIFYGADLGGGTTPFALDLRDGQGNVVPEKPRVSKESRGGSFFMIPIPPGKSIQREVILNRVFDIKISGSYTIQAWRESGAEGASIARVKSNKVNIDVLP